MSEYEELVERQRALLKAEEGGKVYQVYTCTVHHQCGMTITQKILKVIRMYLIIVFFSGVIKRYQDGKLLRTFGEELVGDDLISKYSTYVHDSN